MKTYSPKPGHIERRWYVIDAGGQVLGRVASEAAALLRGKHKPIFAPHMDTGDNVIIVNAAKVELTGAKHLKKFAYSHSGYPGGIKATAYGKLMAEKPVFAVEKAIRGMLPKNRLGRAMISKLHVFSGPEHHHQAQKPVGYTLGRPPMWEGLPGKPLDRASGAVPPQDKPATKRAPEAVAAPAAVEAKAELTAPSTSVAKSTHEIAAKPAAKSVAKTTAKSTAKPAEKAKTTAKSTAKSTAKPAAKAKTTAKSTSKSTAKPKTIAKSTAKPAAKAKTTAKSPAKAKTTAKSTAKPAAKAKTTAKSPAKKTAARKPAAKKKGSS